ncbi:MAG: thiamine pyrophosphate-dependent dehydrogenase E1 component subunit alpha [Clostridiales Family XIII bacterium]|jgi:pyruvate dehydrogenase E1 component alpha subunit|nr:thiamine pyrophosphate-dependent dehydrogenase E1 component subunit alpha [Clostridiales Family XIII bacterium]
MRALHELLADKAFLAETMRKLMLARKFEEKVFDLFAEGKVHGTTHLGIGEEGTAVGTVTALAPEDYALVTHRGHGQVLAKGSHPNDMMAEILARETGVNHGRGGSMHLSDIRYNTLGMDGILGASCPIACGIALSFKMRGVTDRIACVFFGDGSMNQGAVHEAFNLAAAWKLPVLFVCTNNTYGMSTPLWKVVADTDLTKRGIPYGIQTYEVDGNDVLATYLTACEAREYILREQKPAFIVEHTYRTSGHSKSDGNKYRTKEEIAEWKAKNPVIRFTQVMLGNGFSPEEIAEIDRETTRVIDEAAAYGESCPNPTATPEDLEKEVYAS